MSVSQAEGTAQARRRGARNDCNTPTRCVHAGPGKKRLLNSVERAFRAKKCEEYGHTRTLGARLTSETV